MKIEELEDRIRILESQVKTYQDIEEIKKLQRIYGYYLEHWMANEIIDLFSDSPDTALELWVGTYLGKEGIRRYFKTFFGEPSSEFMHQVMQLSGVVDLNPDGETAKGRWYGWGSTAVPSDAGVRQGFMNGIYEMEYVKENGKWKIKKLHFNRNYMYSIPAGQGWVKPDRAVSINSVSNRSVLKPDMARPFDPGYPSGYILPFHFKHPVTGLETSEKKRNSSLNVK